MRRRWLSSALLVGLVIVGLLAGQASAQTAWQTVDGDSFDRADGTGLGVSSIGASSWSADAGTWGIASNAARIAVDPGTLAGTPTQIATVLTGFADVAVTATLSGIPNNGRAGLVFRGATATQFFAVGVTSTGGLVYQENDGSVTSLAGGGSSCTPPVVLRAEVIGTSLTVACDGVAVATRTVALSGFARQGLWFKATSSAVDGTATRWDSLLIEAITPDVCDWEYGGQVETDPEPCPAMLPIPPEPVTVNVSVPPIEVPEISVPPIDVSGLEVAQVDLGPEDRTWMGAVGVVVSERRSPWRRAVGRDVEPDCARMARATVHDPRLVRGLAVH